MADFNRIIIVGNLTRNPEYKQLPSGQAICRLGLAANRQFKNRQTNENVQEVCFVDVDVWGAQAESCNQYLEKGRMVLVEGRLKFDTWQDAEGNPRSKHSIVADRVVFLNSNATQQIGDETATAGLALNAAKKVAPERPARAPRAKVESPASDLPEFKDEPPFQDDLPF
ncbi:MAG TPA: single-stranded DNA-binding protein [Candidatus Babeliales bacterium]|nr:single-stranded DNA-binding protein [Candidatus Babeliales bacterium]